MGVTKMPRKLPNAELNMAAASLPPAARVRMVADDTGGGIQPTIIMPRSRRGCISVIVSADTTICMQSGIKTIVYSWTKACSRYCMKDRPSSCASR